MLLSSLFSFVSAQDRGSVKGIVKPTKAEVKMAIRILSQLVTAAEKNDWKTLKGLIYTDKYLSAEGRRRMLEEMKEDTKVLRRAKIGKIEFRNVDCSIYDEEDLEKLLIRYRGRWAFLALGTPSQKVVNLELYPGKTVRAPFIQINLIPTKKGFKIFNYLNFKMAEERNYILIHEDKQVFILPM